jgi:hypothetical protein
MNSHKFLLIAAVSAFTFTTARAQYLPGENGPKSATANSPTRAYNAATQSTGTIIKKDIRWNSKVPLEATYGELNDEQRAELLSMYEKLEPGDEPPYPLEGMKPIFSAIKKAQRVLQARGELNMVVNVDAEGKATTVEDRGNVYNAQMTELTQQVLLLTKYKPAVCKGQPCAMQFRFTQKLQPG